MEEGIEEITVILADSLIRLGVQRHDTDVYLAQINSSRDLQTKAQVLKKMAGILVQLADTGNGKPPSEMPVDESSRDKMNPSADDYWRLEEILQRYEGSIREHIRIEQSIKIYSDCLKEKTEQMEHQIEKLKEEHGKAIQVVLS